MKKLWFVLIVGIFMIGLVSAVCSDDNQIIMKLFSASNSHGALWNDSNYDYDICFDGFVPTTPHPECTVENSFLWLNSVDNSHASTTKTDDYATGVCYGNLECGIEVIDDGSNCEDGSEPILSLYSQTNSHMAAGNFDGYDVKICCDATEIYWADANGVLIDDSMPNIGDTIQAVKTGASSGTFNVWEKTYINENFLNIVGNSSSGNLVGKWTITEKNLIDAGGTSRFAFEVDNSDEYSEEIGVNGTYDDSLMEVTIVAPACGSNYSVDSSVTIEVNATDEDDFLEGNVSVGGVVVDSFVNGGVSFSYDFDVAGNVQIVAEAVNTRGKKARHISNVMILGGDGNYVAACIAEPKDFSDMDDYVVEFDASTTRAIVVSNSGASETPYNPTDNPTKFSWYWRFMPENIVREFVKSSDSLAYKFTAEFPIAGDNSAGLRVEFS